MTKSIAIIAGEPNSISSEIIFKSWISRKRYYHKPFFVIGSFDLLNLQNKKLKYKIKLKKINKDFTIKDLNKNKLPIYDIKYKQKKPFIKISNKSSNYIFNCFDEVLKLIKKKKIIGFINCPIAKESLLGNKHNGITEFLSNKAKVNGNEVMLIYNKKLSVSPITTHVPLKNVVKKINKNKIIKKVKIINNFYKKFLNRKPKIGILGLNPHNYNPLRKSEEKEIILKSVKILNKQKIYVKGPIVTDTSFMMYKKYKFDVLVGMYHDQVLTPFKTLFNFDAINITLGLPYIRVSPDHGTGKDIIGKKIANPKSLIESIKFFNNI